MERIVGRTDDMIIVRGVNVFPSQIETVLLQVGESALCSIFNTKGQRFKGTKKIFQTCGSLTSNPVFGIELLLPRSGF
jgi:acyl-CoA synthetase (AMP-forming)/AMP-acid ligase II